MSMTAVPISIRLVRAPTAASSGNGDPSCLAKWCTRKYAPSAPSSSAATARSIDCSNASDADRVCEPGDDDQCPNDRKPIFFISASTRTAQMAFLAAHNVASSFLDDGWHGARTTVDDRWVCGQGSVKRACVSDFRRREILDPEP